MDKVAAIAKSSAKRGSEFEADVAKLLRAAGFDVTPNAKTAKPRQTDFFARGSDLDILVEAKNQKRSIQVGDVDNLRLRLNRTASDIVGVLFTTSKLSRSAIEAIETNRNREVLVFVKDEIEGLTSGRQNFVTLLERKRSELRVHGKVWFWAGTQVEFSTVKLPSGNVEFHMEGLTKPYFETASDFGAMLYTLEIPDAGWGIAHGEGARLSIRLTLDTIESLRNIFGYLHQKFGLSNSGAFSIRQSQCSWHGVGAEHLLRTAENWCDRYSQSRAKAFHHSEQISYFDQFRNGWIELSSQQRVGRDSRRSRLHNSELVIQLSGVPVDSSPFVKLCRYTRNDWANFEYIPEKYTFSRRLRKPLALQVVGKTTDQGPSWEDDSGGEVIVVAVVARNPFYLSDRLPKELSDSELPPLNALTKTELLVCSLRDWHDDGTIVDRYELQGFEIAVVGTGLAIRPFGSWGKVLEQRTSSRVISDNR